MVGKVYVWTVGGQISDIVTLPVLMVEWKVIRVYTERRLNQSYKFTLGVKSSLALILCHAIVLLITVGD